MRIVLTGGGSGGHITPVLAVANELKLLSPGVRIIYIGQTGDQLADIPAAHQSVDEVYSVRAGKFRRYHGAGWRQIFDVPTQIKNMRDAFWVAVGIWQSFWLLRKLKPGLIFSRGGFVSVPVALGGKLNGIPYITHDSDSVPSLANRIIARWAALHAVALPAELYPYPKHKTVTVGVPVSGEFKAITSKLQQKYRDELGLGAYQHILLVTGGGNGARRLNLAVIDNVPGLLKTNEGLAIVHIAGRTLESEVRRDYDGLLSADERPRVFVKGFVGDFYRYSGAADVIIARGGATNLVEFAAQRKACIIVPASQLVGGHQVKNAEALASRGAIIMLTEAESEYPGRLDSLVSELLVDASKRTRLSEALGEFARPDAARRLAVLLLDHARE